MEDNVSWPPCSNKCFCIWNHLLNHILAQASVGAVYPLYIERYCERLELNIGFSQIVFIKYIENIFFNPQHKNPSKCIFSTYIDISYLLTIYFLFVNSRAHQFSYILGHIEHFFPCLLTKIEIYKNIFMQVSISSRVNC